MHDRHRQQDLLQVDYLGGSIDRRLIERHYNSNHTINYQVGYADPFPFGPGPAAKYFQNIFLSNRRANRDCDGHSSGWKASGLRWNGNCIHYRPRCCRKTHGPARRLERHHQFFFSYHRRFDGDIRRGWSLDSDHYRSGLVESVQYDPSDTQVTVTNSYGRQLVFTVSGRRITQVQDPAGQTIYYQYDTAKNLAQVKTYQDGTSTQYHYQGFNLIGVTDENNSRYSTYTYDGANHVASSELAGGVEKYTFTWDGGSRYVTDPQGVQRTYLFGAPTFGMYRLQTSSSVSNSVNAAKAVTYDANANIASKTDFNNNQTT